MERDIYQVLGEYNLDRRLYPADPNAEYRCSCSQIITRYLLATNRVNGNVLMIGTECQHKLIEVEEPNEYQYDDLVVPDEEPVVTYRMSREEQREYDEAE